MHVRSRAARALLCALPLVVLALGASESTSHAQPRSQAPAPKLTKEPKLGTFVNADFPESEKARADRSPVTVVLRLDISERGDVTLAEVTTSAGAAFDAAALAAARRFVFEPAEIDGKPSKIRILYRYVFTFPEEAPKTATFRGTVRSRSGSAPLAGVEITLDDGKRAVTDPKGQFVFEGIAPGTRTVTLSGERLTPVRTEETLVAGKALDATYDVELAPEKGAIAAPSDDLEIVVTAPALERRAVSTEIKADEGKRLPGTQGDVLKVVESMPGVARASAGSGQLVVWGASPEETRIYVDGVRVPRLYHDGGLRSIVATELVDSVELAPGAYGAAYGRGLGGIVLVRTKKWDEARPRASLGVDLYDASASLRVPLTKEIRVEIAGRRSHVDSILSALAKDDVGDFFPAPHYADGQARISYAPSEKERASITLLGSTDRTDRTVKSSDPLLTRSEEKGTSFFRIYGKYEREIDGGRVEVTPSFGRDLQTRTIQLGDTSTGLRQGSTIYATRASYRNKVHPHVTLTTGLDAEIVHTRLERSGSVTSPPREGDARVFGQPPQDRRNGDDWEVTQLGLAPFGELDVALLDDMVHVVPGLRFDPTFVSVSRRTPVEGDTPALGAFREDAAIEPRLAATVAPSSRITFKAAYARVRQPALAEDLSAVFGNPLLPAASGHHLLAGLSARLFPSTTLETTVFRLTQDELAARSASATPQLAAALEPVGSGRAYGMQAMLRRELTKGFMGWVSYSLVRSERRDAPSLGYRPSDYDQSHVLTALGSYDLGHGFEVGARVRFATGFPRTAVSYALADTRSDRFEPVFGQKNRERLPAFFQVDLRISKRFVLPAGELETYLEVLNVTNQQNAEELVYTKDYRTKGTLTGLPILPLFGVRWNL